MQNKDYNEQAVSEIISIIENEKDNYLILDLLSDYHDKDIAEAFEQLSEQQRRVLYGVFGTERMSDIFSFIDDVSTYLEELELSQAVDVLESMDADDAVDALDDVEDEEKRQQYISLMEGKASEDIKLITSYSDEQIGSMMTTEFVKIPDTFTIKQATKSVIKQASECENINTIYVIDENNKYCGAVELRDLIIARDYTPLEEIVSKNYPYLKADDLISENIKYLKSYAEDSMPVLNAENEIIGVVTYDDMVEAVDSDLSEDYMMFAGVSDSEDLKEKVTKSMAKRLPWLVLLFFLGMLVSAVVGIFEPIVEQVAVVICFQSLILGMAGNIGTQSLAVTIRVLMDNFVTPAQKVKFVFKELRVGAGVGALLGSLAVLFIGVYLHLMKAYIWQYSFRVSFCVGAAMFLSMIISSLVGTVIPMFFKKIKIDPAVASGPLITTINDLVAVVTYYTLAAIFLVSAL